MKSLPTLYSRSKLNTLWSWRVWTEGDTIKTESGAVDGAKQIYNRIASPKNIGRANATTAEQQAEAEAKSMWQHQRDRRYRESPAEAEIRVFLPMLARSKKVEMSEQSKIKFPADLQIKYDGLRALSYWDSGEVRFLSRSGKYFDLPHLKKILEKFLPQGHILDGELYHHGTHLQTINSWVKRRQRESLKLSYRTYDCPEYFGETGPWRERRVQLESIMAQCPEPKVVTLVKSFTVHNLTEAYKIVEEKFMVDGYEGGILRLHSGYYNYSKRSNDLLKLKLFDEDDFEIIGFKGGEKGTREEKAVIWKCKTEAGKEFDVRPTGTYAEREEIFKEAKTYLGKMYSVKYKGTSIEGKPLFPVGLAFKEDR